MNTEKTLETTYQKIALAYRAAVVAHEEAAELLDAAGFPRPAKNQRDAAFKTTMRAITYERRAQSTAVTD